MGAAVSYEYIEMVRFGFVGTLAHECITTQCGKSCWSLGVIRQSSRFGIGRIGPPSEPGDFTKTEHLM